MKTYKLGEWELDSGNVCEAAFTREVPNILTVRSHGVYLRTRTIETTSCARLLRRRWSALPIIATTLPRSSQRGAV